MANLNIFPNELDKDQTKQNVQINLALSTINTWANKVSNSSVTNISNDTAQSTTSTTPVNIPNYTLQFKNINPVLLVTVNLSLNANGNQALVQLMLDGAVIGKARASLAGTNIVSFVTIVSTSVGSHNLSLQWSTASGTINKVADGGSSLTVVNLI